MLDSLVKKWTEEGRSEKNPLGDFLRRHPIESSFIWPLINVKAMIFNELNERKKNCKDKLGAALYFRNSAFAMASICFLRDWHIVTELRKQNEEDVKDILSQLDPMCNWLYHAMGTASGITELEKPEPSADETDFNRMVDLYRWRILSKCNPDGLVESQESFEIKWLKRLKYVSPEPSSDITVLEMGDLNEKSFHAKDL